MGDLFANVASKLRRDHYVLLDGFLAGSDLHQAVSGAKAAWQNGLLSEGGVLAGGRTGGSLAYRKTDRRGDVIGWFDGDEKPIKSWAQPLIERVDAFVSELKPHMQRKNELRNLGNRSRLMVTCYPGGDAQYIRHVDNAPDERNGRRLTAIVYLNVGWDADRQGGALRIFGPLLENAVKESDAVTDIAPSAGRLVLFWSDWRVPHAVLPARAPRFAATVWYNDLLERAEAESALADASTRRGENARIASELARVNCDVVPPSLSSPAAEVTGCPGRKSNARSLAAGGASCMACGSSQSLKRCGRCKTVSFCSAECQRRAWPSHRAQCALASKRSCEQDEDVAAGECTPLHGAASAKTGPAHSASSSASDLPGENVQPSRDQGTDAAERERDAARPEDLAQNASPVEACHVETTSTLSASQTEDECLSSGVLASMPSDEAARVSEWPFSLHCDAKSCTIRVELPDGTTPSSWDLDVDIGVKCLRISSSLCSRDPGLSITLPPGVETDNATAKASFKRGKLTVTLPRFT